MYYPTIEKIVADLAQPLLNDATVDADISAIPRGNEVEFEVMQAKLELPLVTKEEFEQLPKTFALRVRHAYSDGFGIEANFYFTFDVEIIGLGDEEFAGQHDMVYNARLKNTEHD